MNDAWIFDIRTLEWQELALPYDHGEIRCWHGAVYSDDGGELIIHSGLTQVPKNVISFSNHLIRFFKEYYLNRIQLDGHSETILTIPFGVKSLFRIGTKNTNQ